MIWLILYTQNSKEPTKELLKLVKKGGKSAGSKYIHKKIIFLYATIKSQK